MFRQKHHFFSVLMTIEFTLAFALLQSADTQMTCMSLNFKCTKWKKHPLNVPKMIFWEYGYISWSRSDRIVSISKSSNKKPSVHKVTVSLNVMGLAPGYKPEIYLNTAFLRLKVFWQYICVTQNGTMSSKEGCCLQITGHTTPVQDNAARDIALCRKL